MEDYLETPRLRWQNMLGTLHRKRMSIKTTTIVSIDTIPCDVYTIRGGLQHEFEIRLVDGVQRFLGGVVDMLKS